MFFGHHIAAGHCADLCRLHLDVTLMYIGLGSLQSIGVFVCVWVSLLGCACLVHPSFVVGACMSVNNALMHAQYELTMQCLSPDVEKIAHYMPSHGNRHFIHLPVCHLCTWLRGDSVLADLPCSLPPIHYCCHLR